MRIAVLGGAGAMGGLFGSRLAAAGEEVLLVDVWETAVANINAEGLRLKEKSGDETVIRATAVTNPNGHEPVDLLIVFVKSYHTEAAVKGAHALLKPDTVVLSLQNGWGNAARISAVVGEERILVGVTYNSATVLGPGHIHQAGIGQTIIGELNGRMTGRLEQISAVLNSAGLETVITHKVLEVIWSKLALNVCTLPTSALLRFYAGELIEHQGTLDLMRELLRETAAVAQAQNIHLDEAERWESITGLLRRAKTARASMLQDVENGRQTEINVINGAITAAGQQHNIPTPYNEAMVWMIRSLEETFGKKETD